MSVRSEDGTALPVVILVAVLLATVVGALALVLLAERRLVAREVGRTQAAYAAEAGVFAALARLEADTAWRPDGELLDVGEGVPEDSSRVRARVWVRPYGAFLQVASVADIGRQRARAVAVVGREPPPAFEAALVFGDAAGRLVLAGDATVEGPIWTGPRGWDTETLGRRPFSGSVRGDHRAFDESPLPPLDASTFDETLDRALGSVSLPDEAVVEAEAPFAPDVAVVRPGPVLDGAGLDASGLEADVPVVVLAAGDLEVTGPLPDGATVVATGVLTASGLEARGVLLVADRVRVRGGELQGQALGRREVTVEGGAWWAHPSVVYAHEPPARAGEGGVVLDDAWIDGLAVTPELAERGPPSAGEAASLVIREGATVRGAVYAGRRAEVAGRVWGTLLARQFAFYRSPSAYVNWVDGAEVRVGERPDALAVPWGLGSRPFASVRLGSVVGVGSTGAEAGADRSGLTSRLNQE